MFKYLIDTFKRNGLAIFMASVFACVQYILLGPFEMMYYNANEFPFSINKMLSVLVLLFVFAVSAMMLLGILLPERIGRIYYSLIFAFSVGTYIQNSFLNRTSMITVSGSKVEFTVVQIVVNTLIWLMVFVVIIIASIEMDNRKFKSIIIYLSTAFSILLLICVIKVGVDDSQKPIKMQNDYLSTEGMLELSSKGNNVVVFLVDTFDIRVMDGILAKEPNYLDSFGGFEYYKNCTSTYSRTYPSVVHMLTKKLCYFDKQPEEWVEEAYSESDFWNELGDNKYNVYMDTDVRYLGEKGKKASDNYCEARPMGVDRSYAFGLVEKMTLYRNLPCILKGLFEYDLNLIDDDIMVHGDGPDKVKYFDDAFLNSALTYTGVSAADNTDNYFKFYHMRSFHDGFRIEGALFSLDVIKEYIRQMIELGLYDSSTIIILADHGDSDAGSLDISSANAPLLLVKRAGDKWDGCKINNAPVAHTDFLASVADSLGMSGNYGKAFWDYSESEEVERYYYHTALYDDLEGEIELREYKVDGLAEKMDSYIYTGNRWDIMYSLNIVKKK